MIDKYIEIYKEEKSGAFQVLNLASEGSQTAFDAILEIKVLILLNRFIEFLPGEKKFFETSSFRWNRNSSKHNNITKLYLE